MKLTEHALRRASQIVGRRRLWRIGRTIYFAARREPRNEIETNGERSLQLNLASIAAARQRKWTVVDVGANVGLWAAGAIEAAQAAGVAELDLFAFEPEPTARETLKSRLQGAVRQEYRTRVSALALSDRPGRSKMLVQQPGAGSNGLVVDIDEADPRGIDVDLTTLDDFAEENGLAMIDLVKIDAEGYDLKIVQGAASLLRQGRISVLQFEYNWRWVHTRSFLMDVFELIGGHPYKLGKLTSDGIELYSEWHPELERFIEGNYVLVRDDFVDSIQAKLGKFDNSNTYAAS